MTTKKFYTWNDIENMCTELLTKIYGDFWKPELIVGITRGGNVPATILSNMTKIACDSLTVRLRDGRQLESNLGMAEDAYKGKKILVVDDINDTGETFNWITQDWSGSCFPNDDRWNEIWGNNVRFAVLTENLSSKFDKVSYWVDEVNKAENNVWLVYPWENVGKYV